MSQSPAPGSPHPNDLQSALANLNQRLQSLESIPLPVPPFLSSSDPVPKIPLPEKYDGHLSRFRDFMFSVENVFALQKSRYPTDEVKTRFVGSLLVKDALAWFRNIAEYRPFVLADYESFVAEFKELFDDPNSQRHAQAALKRLRQGKGSVLSYSAKFRRLAGETGYNDKALLDAFRDGLNDDVKDVLATSIEEPDSYDQFIRFCIRIDQRLYDRRLERSGGNRFSRPGINAGRREQGDSGVAPMDLDSMRAEPSRARRLTEEERKNRLENGLCLYCGESGHLLASCPSRPQRPSHASSASPSSSFGLSVTQVVSPPVSSPVSSASADPSVGLSVTQVGSPLSQPSLFLKSTMEFGENNFACNALLDSGANANFISLKLIEERQIETEYLTTPLTVRLADGSTYSIDKILSDIKLSVLCSNPSSPLPFSSCRASFLVAPLKFDVVVGTPWLSQVNPLIDWRNHRVSFPASLASMDVSTSVSASRYSPEEPIVLSPACFDPRPDRFVRFASLELTDTVTTVDGDEDWDIAEPGYESEGFSPYPSLPSGVPLVYAKFACIFYELRHHPLPPERSFDLEINLRDPEKTHPFLPIYNLSRREQSVLKDWIDDNLSKGLIRPSTSPSAAPIFFVKKKDGSLRPCIDYRELNSNTIPDGFPLPLISDIMGRFSAAKFFTTLDLKGAYNLIRIKPGDEWKAAFRCQYGLFEPLVVQFGLVNAPSVFQRFIISLFMDLLDVCVVVYLDDILVYSDSYDSHVKHVTEVLKRIEDNNLVLKTEKCVFHSKSVNYLGHVISDKGIGMARDKVQALAEFPPPANVKDLRSFLGLANYYRKFLPDFSGRALPLTDLTKKGRHFHWDHEAMAAFVDLKSAIAKDVVLQHPCYEQPFEVFTDASDFAIGAVLTQNDESGDMRPIEFYSRKLLTSERNYSVYDKELLAILEALGQWRHLLISSPHVIRIHSDHKNLSYFRKAQLLKPRHARWAEFLSQFNFSISHIAGEANAVADALSRSPLFQDSSSTANHKNTITVLPEENWQDTGVSLALVSLLPDCCLELSVDQVQDLNHDWPEDVARYLQSSENIWECDHHDLETYRKHIANFTLLGERLYYSKDQEKRLYLPKEQHKSTLKRFHDDLGHLATDSIMPLLKRRYWWPGFEQSIRDYVSNCPRCHLARGQPVGSSYVQPIPPVALPFERWGLDFMQNLPETVNGNKHIITCIDYATRWVVAQPVPEMTTEAVVRFLYKNILMCFGAPFEIITDRGKSFLAEAVQQFESLHHIRHISTTPYHPRTNGMVERMHSMINHSLTTLTGSQPRRWDEHLDATVFAIRVRTHAVTKRSPFFLLYGVEPRLPGDLDPPRQAMAPLSQLEQLEARSEFTARELEEMGQERAAAYERSVAQARRMATSRPDGDSSDFYFDIGDWVKLKHFDRGKFEFKWTGPYHVVQLGHPRTYWLMAPDGRRLDSTVNEEHLAPWTARIDDNQDFFYDGTNREANSGL